MNKPSNMKNDKMPCGKAIGETDDKIIGRQITYARHISKLHTEKQPGKGLLPFPG